MLTFSENPNQQSSNPYMRFSKVFQPQQNTTAPKREQRIFAVQTAEQLLQEPECVLLLQEIQDLSAATSKNYQVFYDTLIKNFAQFVQSLPDVDHPAMTWLDHHLRLAKTSLKMREQFLLVGESLHPIVNEQEALWHYVIFSSALLRKIGVLFTDYQVSLCNEQGVHLADWLPFSGSMNSQGTYYKLREVLAQGPTPNTIHHLLARQLMPTEGFEWIAKNPAALLAWLGVVEGEASGGVSHRIVALSEKQLYDNAKREEVLEQLFRARSLQELLKLTGLNEQQILSLLPPLHGAENQNNELAVTFFEGLENIQNLEGLEFLINERQYLIYPNSLMFLMRERPGMFRNWFDFYQKSGGLGLTVLTPSDKMLQTFLTHSLHLQPTTSPEAKTTTALFHQTLYDHNAPTSASTDAKQNSIVHQQNMAHTIEALNQKGLAVGTLYGSAHYHAYTEKNIASAQQEQSQLSKMVETRDQLTQFHDTVRQAAFEQHQKSAAHHHETTRKTALEYQQKLGTQQQQLRQKVSSQYPFDLAIKSQFTYSNRS